MFSDIQIYYAYIYWILFIYFHILFAGTKSNYDLITNKLFLYFCKTKISKIVLIIKLSISVHGVCLLKVLILK